MKGAKIQLDYDNLKQWIHDDEMILMQKKVDSVHQILHEKSAPGNKFLGWLDLPEQNVAEIPEFNDCVSRIQEDADALICIGIGGSYLGARAVIDAISPVSPNKQKSLPEIYYIGQNIDTDYLAKILNIINEKKCYVNVISKSGTTTEPGIAFRIIKNELEKKYSKEELKDKIIATTDKSRGALRKLADIEGYTTFVIPDDVGGRFSVLTPVGLLPIAASGCDVNKLLDGARDMAAMLMNPDINENLAYLYAGLRNLLYSKGKSAEILANFDQKLFYYAEWWKQLFGESEGKGNMGIFPASVNFTTDLHSLGQYIQDGMRFIFETFLIVEKTENEIFVPLDEDNYDGLNFLAQKTLSEINFKAYQGTANAHFEGGVPNMTFFIPTIDEYWLGQLIFLFEKSVAISGYLLGVNPFNQPGVEAYKRKMFELLGKPGFVKE